MERPSPAALILAAHAALVEGNRLFEGARSWAALDPDRERGAIREGSDLMMVSLWLSHQAKEG